MNTILSSIFPPTPDCQHHTVYAHKDGRRVHYVRGKCSETEACKKLVEELGNVSGFVGSVYYHESFPGEPVCMSCVSWVETWSEGEDGNKKYHWLQTPDFSNRPRLKLCPTCLKNAAAVIRAKYEREMRSIGAEL
jgi:hypothetical protein